MKYNEYLKYHWPSEETIADCLCWKQGYKKDMERSFHVFFVGGVSKL